MDQRKWRTNGLSCLISVVLPWQAHAHGLATTERGEAMPGVKPVAGLRAILAGACTVTWISAARPAIAGQLINDVCRPIGGGPTCTVNPAPAGSPCGCFTPVGRVAGRIEAPEKETAITCQITKDDLCRSARPAYVGDECQCARDPGKV